MRNISFPSALLLATLSGCLWFVAVTPFDQSWLAWIAAVPMFMAIEGTARVRNALLLGWWAGIVETGGGFYWLIDTTQRFASFPWIGAAAVFVAFCVARGLIFLLFTAVVVQVRRRLALPMTLLAPIAMVSAELVVPQIFPCGQWISQAWHPLIIQISEITGALGVTALLMMVNGGIYDTLTNPRGTRYALVIATLILGADLAFSALRMRSIDAQVAHAPHLRIGLVQPNFAYSVEGEYSRAQILDQLGALQAQSQRLARAGAQLLIWSEGSYPITLPRDFTADFSTDSLARIQRDFTVPTLVGAEMLDEARDDAYNTALLLDARGTVAGRYDKVRLLAFGEYIPGVETFPWLRRFLPEGAGRFTAGSGPAVLPFQTPAGDVWRLGPAICYEDILQGFLQSVGQLHPDLLVNLTSDSWFGAAAEPWEHLALSIFASVELRTGMVRAVNSGVSAYIDPVGRVQDKSYADDPYRQPRGADGMVVSAAKLPGGHTVFTRVGNLFAYLCVAATVICCFAASPRRRAHA